MENNYTTYNPLDFAQDDWFIRWVKNTDPEAEAFWQNWLEKHPEKKPEVEEAKAIVLSITVEENEPQSAQLDALWNKIEKGTKGNLRNSKGSIRPLYKRWLPYAAAAAVAAVLFFVFYPTGTSVRTDYGELLVYDLPDGSTVELNAGSRIWFNPEHWTEDRKVKLWGEAFFEVEKGNRFLVETKNGAIEVLGTSFNVFSRGEELEVDCFTGKVAVRTRAEETAILNPAEATRKTADNRLEEKKNIDVEKKAGWRVGKLDMVNVPLQRVYDELERQFDIKIEANVEQEVLDQMVDVYFERTRPDSALTRATWPFALEFEIKGNEVTITPSK